MTEYTFSYDLFSDVYKDAHGFRPRNHRFYDADTTDAERQRIWDYTLAEVERAIEEDRRLERLAIERFEKRIADLISIGAGDRETAVRWIRDTYTDGDYEERVSFIEFDLGLPYGYIANDRCPDPLYAL